MFSNFFSSSPSSIKITPKNFNFIPASGAIQIPRNFSKEDSSPEYNLSGKSAKKGKSPGQFAHETSMEIQPTQKQPMSRINSTPSIKKTNELTKMPILSSPKLGKSSSTSKFRIKGNNLSTSGGLSGFKKTPQKPKPLKENSSTPILIYTAYPKPNNKPTPSEKGLGAEERKKKREEAQRTLDYFTGTAKKAVPSAANSALLSAAKSNSVDMCLEYLSRAAASRPDVDAKDSSGWTSLHFACQNKSLNLVRILLQNKATVNVDDNNYITPLMVACAQYPFPLMSFIEIETGFESFRGSLEILSVLMNHGANCETVDSKLNNAMHYAVATNSVDCTRFLMGWDSLKEQKNRDGKTPFDMVRSKEIKELFLGGNEGKKNHEDAQNHKKPLQRHGGSRSPSSGLKAKNSEANSEKSTITPSTVISMSKPSNEKPSLGLYSIKALLGKGSFGEVFLVQRKDIGGLFAMKMLDKNRIASNPSTFLMIWAAVEVIRDSSSFWN